MRLETITIQPIIAKPFHFLLYPWRKYNDYFDKNCWGIWGLSPLLKYTFLFLALFFVPPIIGIVNYESADTGLFFALMVIAFLAIAFVWIVYLPILGIIVIKRAIQKALDFGSKSKANLSKEPQEFISETKKQANNIATLINVLRYLWFIYSAKLIYKYRKQLEEITSIYPFSLLFKDRMWHARNKIIIKTIRKIEKLSSEAKVPVLIVSIGDNPYLHFWAKFTKTKGYPVKKLERALQKEFDTIYVRKVDKGQIQINTTISEES